MSFEKILAIGLVTAFSCIFWLAVNVFDGWVQRNVYPKIRLKLALLREKICRRHSTKSADDLRSPRRIGKKDIGS